MARNGVAHQRGFSVSIGCSTLTEHKSRTSNCRTYFFYVAICFFLVSTAFSQTPFINLDFEQAPTPPGANNTASVAVALPGWTVFSTEFSTVQTKDTIGYDIVPSQGTWDVSIHDAQSTLSPIGGNFSVHLQGYIFRTITSSASISQVGFVPPGTKSVHYSITPGTFMDVSFEGHSLSTSPFESHPNYTVQAADISQFAGQTGQLVFTAYYFSPITLDDIAFSPLPVVPEPNVYTLAFLGASILILIKRIKPLAASRTP